MAVVEAEHLVSAARPDQILAESLPEVAFLGRSNVGKSSLLNKLVRRRELAFTSSKPGCTQVINFYKVGVEPSHDAPARGSWVFVDLPGYGYARVPADIRARWKDLIEAYLNERRSLCLSFLLLDSRRGWMEPDLELLRWLEFSRLEYAVIATKVDKLNRKEEHRSFAAIRERIPDRELLAFSAVTGQGVREIWQAISKTRISPQ